MKGHLGGCTALVLLDLGWVLQRGVGNLLSFPTGPGQTHGVSLFLEGLIHLHRHKLLRFLPWPSLAQNRADFEGIGLSPRGEGGDCVQGRPKPIPSAPRMPRLTRGDPPRPALLWDLSELVGAGGFQSWGRCGTTHQCW